jgi:hypothetical protein
MKFFCLPNLSSQDVKEGDPRKAGKRPELDDKKAFRAWCENPKTEHCFYNHVEGMVPSLRVTADTASETANPPLYMWGFTVDYDTDMTLDDAVKQVKKNADSGKLPMFASQTFSGGVRLTWEFEDRVLVDNPDIAQRFVEELAKDLGAKSLIGGIDANSLKLTQYYEAGTNWTEFPDARPLLIRDLGMLFYRAATSVKIGTEYNIPIEAVEEEVLKRWPEHAKGFKEGARMPLFWVEPFVDRVGSQVGQYGMLCYSDRAGKSFVPWSEILGREFAKEYEAKRIGAAVQELCWNGKHYFLTDDFIQLNKDDVRMHLRGMGVGDKPRKGKWTTEVEDVLITVQKTNRVVAAVPLVHNSDKFVEIKGERVLNISRTRLLTPADTGNPEKFPFLYRWFWRIWSDPEELQRDTWLFMLKYAYEQCLSGKPKPGQASFIAGPTGVGKTLYNLRVLGGIFGKTSDASEFLLGKTNFNKENCEAFIWAIDDNQGAVHFEHREALAANIKRYVANPEVRCEAKGIDSYIIPWTGRISVTCNHNIRSLQIIPNLDITTEGKIQIFSWRNGDRAPDFGTYGSKEATIAEELPYFCRFLMNWVPPANVVGSGRYAVKEYHHPDIMKKIETGAPRVILMELLDNLLAAEPAKTNEWVNLSQLTEYINQTQGGKRLTATEFGKQRLHMALEEAGYPRRWRGNSPQFQICQSEAIAEMAEKALAKYNQAGPKGAPTMAEKFRHAVRKADEKREK